MEFFELRREAEALYVEERNSYDLLTSPIRFHGPPQRKSEPYEPVLAGLQRLDGLHKPWKDAEAS